jgi:hypothetical protein
MPPRALSTANFMNWRIKEMTEFVSNFFRIVQQLLLRCFPVRPVELVPQGVNRTTFIQRAGRTNLS